MGLGGEARPLRTPQITTMATATAPTQKRRRSAAAQAEAPTLDLPGLPDEKLFDAAQSGDQRARELLVERFLPLARRIALRYRQSGQPLDDLFQVASLGLVKAIDRFDHARGVAFTSYAVPTIMGEIKRYFRDFGWSVHVPRGLQERSELVRRAVEALHTELGRSPSVTELA